MCVAAGEELSEREAQVPHPVCRCSRAPVGTASMLCSYTGVAPPSPSSEMKQQPSHQHPTEGTGCRLCASVCRAQIRL